MNRDPSTTTSITKTKNKSAPWVLIALALLFIGPTIAAWSLYTFKVSWLDSRVNYGQLVQPPLNFNQLDLKNPDGSNFAINSLQGHWTMLYVSPLPCAKICQTNLYNMRQVRIATGKERERVQRLLVTFPGVPTTEIMQLLNKEYTGTLPATISNKVMLNYFTKDKLKKLTPENGALYLVDPLGNLMMAYPNNAPAKYLLKDLTRLLRTSQIG